MRFSAFAATVHGKKYRERGLPCQDSSAVLEFGIVQAIAVADGHGGKDYFRSDTGARLAVETAFDRLKIFCNALTAEQRFSDSGIKNFELALWEEWNAAVKKHWRDNPATDAEIRWQGVSDKCKARYLSGENISAAYGTTLICAVSIGSQILIEQIGDGSSVIPVPPDAENKGVYHPENLVRDVKMEISNPDVKTFDLDGKTFSKKQIVGSILGEVKRKAKEEIERKQLTAKRITGAVISVPAAFTLRELNLICDAAQEKAKLKVIGFIREPVFAATPNTSRKIISCTTSASSLTARDTFKTSASTETTTA